MKTRCFLLVVMLAICSINTYGQQGKSANEIHKLNQAMDKLDADVKAKMSKSKSTTGPERPKTPETPKTPKTPSRPPREEPGVKDKLLDLYRLMEEYQTETGKTPFFQSPSNNNPQHVVYGAVPSLTVGDDNGSKKDLPETLGVDVNTSDDEIRGYAGKSGSPVYVDPAAITISPNAGPGLFDYATADLPEKQDPSKTYFVLPKDKEQGIQLARELLPLAEERLATFDEKMEKIEQNIALREEQLFNFEKEKALLDYEGRIIMTNGDRMWFMIDRYEPSLKEKFNMTDDELKSFRDNAYTKLGPDAVINEKYSVSADYARIAEILHTESEIGEGVDIAGTLKTLIDAKILSEELIEYDVADATKTWKISLLKNQLNELHDIKESLTKEKDNIQHILSHYSNVIHDGEIVVTPQNDIDAMNLGSMLNKNLDKRIGKEGIDLLQRKLRWIND